eukprot:m51a1_g14349 putative glycoside hydrolase family 18 protein (413) ;mRNA; r:182196-184756
MQGRTTATALAALLLAALCAGAETCVDLKRKDNVVLYWGQNGNEGDLRNYCDGTYDILILSFMHVFPAIEKAPDGKDVPGLNFAGHCETVMQGFGQLLHCPKIGEDVKYCRSKGKIVLLSMGGASGAYAFTSAAQAEGFAAQFWDMFLYGSSAYRPLGDAVLDGVDMDIEGGSASFYSTFVNALRAKADAAGKKVVVGAAPQCAFPDAYMGPDDTRDTLLSRSVVDFVSVQFYNNNPCNLGGEGFRKATTVDYSVGRWTQWAKTRSPYTAIMVGSPASADSATSGGYISDDALKGELDYALQFDNMGGLMLWAAYGAKTTGRGTAMSTWLKAKYPRPSGDNCGGDTPVVVSSEHVDPKPQSSSHHASSSHTQPTPHNRECSKGKVVWLSMGGASGAYAFTSAAQAEGFAAQF